MKLDLDVAADMEGVFKDLVSSLEGVKILSHIEEGPAGGNPCYLLEITNEESLKTIWISHAGDTETYQEFIRLHSVSDEVKGYR